MKRSELATPAGIDHDYNFIAGIERRVDRVEQDVEESPIGMSDPVRKQPAPVKNSAFEKHLRDARVIIVRAPTGMSRERSNNTRLNKKRTQIIWTLEWIHEDQSRELQEVGETTQISEAYRLLLAHRQPLTHRQSKSKKRKFQDESAKELPEAPEYTTVTRHEARQSPMRVEEEEAKPASASGVDLSVGNPTTKSALEDCSTEQLPADTNDAKPICPDVHFYLVKPHTSSTRCVLIPLPPDSTLAACLRDRVVLEFPTIQVLSKSPESLPSGFQLEDDYLDDFSKEQGELDELLATVQPSLALTLKNEHRVAQSTKCLDEDFDDKKILEVLKRDLDTQF